MNNNNRFRYEEKDVVLVDIASATVVEIGDFVQLDTDKLKPASDETWSASLAGTQEAFCATFLGVALQASADGDTAPVRVATAGVFEYPCASASFGVGDRVGCADDESNALEDQKVVAVAQNYLAVGKVVETTSSETTVKIRIKNVVFDGGYQTPETS